MSLHFLFVRHDDETGSWKPGSSIAHGVDLGDLDPGIYIGSLMYVL